jgi:hypothetical protein
MLKLPDGVKLLRNVAVALGRIGGEAARAALAGRGEVEDDGWVREEIAAVPGER